MPTDILDVGGIEKFKPAPDLQGSPVPHEEVIENIRKSAQFDLPILERQPQGEGTMIFCAGGPTLRQYTSEIKKRKDMGHFIVSSNHTHDFLLEHGVVSNACIIMDPKERVKDYIKSPQKETNYYVGIVCNPGVAQNLLDKGMNVTKLMIAFGMETEEDVDTAKELYPHISNKSYLVGGTMTGLRAMNFAHLMGFKTIEYYGLDSCFASDPPIVYSDDPRYEEIKKRNLNISYKDADDDREYVIDEPEDGGFFYAYKKKRGETIQVAKTRDGAIFLTSPCFAHQAKQFIKWIDRMEGKLEVKLHGYSLTSHLLKCHNDEIEEAIKKVGDKRWTQQYADMQKLMHSGKHYGIWGSHDIDLVGRMIISIYVNKNENKELTDKKSASQNSEKDVIEKFLISNHHVSLLDYGCGSGDLGNAINNVYKIVDVTNYDPFMEEYSKEPEGKFDIVTCFDVMEHVEIQCVANTIDYIADRTRFAALFSICCSDALKTLPDGRNAHITQKSPWWWYKMIERRFHIAEAIGYGDYCIFACQALDAVDEMETRHI